MVRPLELQRGAHVRYMPVHSNEWREGVLVRSSPNNEEWLVKNRFGQYWIAVTRLRPLEGPPPDSGRP